MVPPRSVLLIAACAALMPLRAQAQWWSRAPADFEECADKAEKAATKEEKASQLVECNAKFAGRRKPGGGYTYFDFMQNRSFDIAGPNPDAGRAEEDRRAIYPLPRPGAAKPRRGRSQGEAAIAAARLLAKRKGAPAGGGAQQAAGGGERAASEARQLRAAFVLLRLAAAFGTPQGFEEAVQRLAEQGQARLILLPVIPGRGEASNPESQGDHREIPGSRWRAPRNDGVQSVRDFGSFTDAAGRRRRIANCAGMNPVNHGRCCEPAWRGAGAAAAWARPAHKPAAHHRSAPHAAPAAWRHSPATASRSAARRLPAPARIQPPTTAAAAMTEAAWIGFISFLPARRSSRRGRDRCVATAISNSPLKIAFSRQQRVSDDFTTKSAPASAGASLCPRLRPP